MKEICILGLKLRDYSMREKLQLSEKYLHNGILNTIECVTAQMVMRAGEDEDQKEKLEAMDLVVYCDADIAHAAGAASYARLKEIENNSFLKEFIRKLVREKQTVYLIADGEDALKNLKDDLEELSGKLRIVGSGILHEGLTEGGMDTLVNDINDKTPKVLFSLCNYPFQESFIQENKGKINANIWLGLQKGCSIHQEKEKGIRKLTRSLERRLFRKKVCQYENQE